MSFSPGIFDFPLTGRIHFLLPTLQHSVCTSFSWSIYFPPHITVTCAHILSSLVDKKFFEGGNGTDLALWSYYQFITGSYKSWLNEPVIYNINGEAETTDHWARMHETWWYDHTQIPSLESAIKSGGRTRLSKILSGSNTIWPELMSIDIWGPKLSYEDPSSWFLLVQKPRHFLFHFISVEKVS